MRLSLGELAAGGDAYSASDVDRDVDWLVVEQSCQHLLDGVELLHLPGTHPRPTGHTPRP